MPINSKKKGKNGELSLAHELQKYGYDVRRSVQYSGANHDADLENLPGIHIECKRVEKLNIYDAMAQSIHDARENEIPVVMHRRNHDYWKVTMRLEDFMKIYPEWEVHYGDKE